ncbi:hypothetical protein SLS64_006209 [Diaporthe eres]|uniref:Uncharacterized protein n=1 Tax=Diaporthe eres TaxID=83184 RepID=A0ABR1NUR4_DIAER
MSSSPTTASLSLTASRLKAQLDASRRPPQTHYVRRAVSSHSTPKKKREQQRERPKTVAETRSSPPRGRNGGTFPTPRLSASPAKEPSPSRTSAAQNKSPEKWAAPTPSPSRSNSTNSTPGRTSPSKASDKRHLTTQPSPESSRKRQTPTKLKLRDNLSPVKVSSASASARSSPALHTGGYADPIKRDDPRLSSCASPPKRTPPKLKLRRSMQMADLASLGRSPSPRSPAKPSPATTTETEPDNPPSPSTRKTRKD